MNLSKAPDHYIDSMIALSQQQPRLKVIQTKNELNARKKPYNRVINRLPWENESLHLKAKFHSVTVAKSEFELIATHKQKYLLMLNNDYGQNDTIKILCGNQEILAFITSIGRGENKSILSIAVWSIKRGI